MLSAHNLHLHEEVVLLALHETRGVVTGRDAYAAAGGILCELLLAQRIRIEAVKRRRLVRVADERLTGERIVDDWFDHIRKAKKPQVVAYWISRIAREGQLRRRIIERLYLSGIIRQEERRILWLFTRNVYPLQSPEPRRRALERVREAIMTDQPVPARTASLVSLLKNVGLLTRAISREEQKARKLRIQMLISLDPIGNAIRDAIAADSSG